MLKAFKQKPNKTQDRLGSKVLGLESGHTTRNTSLKTPDSGLKTQHRSVRGIGMGGLIGLWLMLCGVAIGQPSVPPPKTTAFTRGLIGTNTTSAEFRSALGFLSTNNTVITNYTGNGASITNLNADELRSGTVPLARLSGITASQVADATLTTNKVDATFHALLGGGGGSGDVTQSGLAAGSYAIAGNGAGLTNIGQCWLVYSNGTSLNFSNNVLAASSNAVWGSTIKLNAGLFYIGSNSIALNPGVNLVGDGAASRIVGYGFGAAVILGTSNLVDSVSVDYDPAALQNLIIETDDTIIFQPFGVPSTAAGGISGKLGYSARLVTNSIIRNVVAHGQSDCLFFNTNGVYLTVEDSVFTTDWDFYYDESPYAVVTIDNVSVRFLQPSLTNSGGDYFSTQNSIVNGTGSMSNRVVISDSSFSAGGTSSILRISSAGNTNTFLHSISVDMPITNGGSPFSFSPSAIAGGHAFINGSNYIFGARTFASSFTLTGNSTNSTPVYQADYDVQSEGFFYTNTTSRRADISLALAASYDTDPGWLGFQVCTVEGTATNYYFSSVFYDSTATSADMVLVCNFPLNPLARFYWQRADGSVADATYIEKVKTSAPNTGAKGSHIIYQ